MGGKKQNNPTRLVVCNIDEKAYSKYFKAFGDASRLHIIGLLAGGEMAVGEIVDAMELSQPTISRHLAILREADIVLDRRDGQRVFYSLNRDVVENCCSGFCDCLMIPAPKTARNRKK
jgi:DNA-binding transcriptional ArsR family regulator